MDAGIVYNPNRDIMEERPYKSDYSMKEINTVLMRAKLFFALMDAIIKADTFLFYYYFPRFSYFMWVFLHLFIFFFDARYLLTYLLLGLIFMVV